MANSKISALTSATTPLAGTEVLPIVQSGATVKASIANIQTATVSGGTANGIQYLNGSKVSTTGSTFQYDGTKAYNNLTAPPSGWTGIGTSWWVKQSAADGGFYAIASGSDAGVFMGHTGTLGKISVSYGNTAGYTPLGFYTSDTLQWQLETNGNITQKVAAKGVNFTANTPKAGMTSQLLNWYEQGTFTPTLSGSGGDPTSTYTAQVGYYTRVGNLVTIYIQLFTSSYSGGSGTLQIKALPWAATNGARFNINTVRITFGASAVQVCAAVDGGSTTMYFDESNSGATDTTLNLSAWNSGASAGMTVFGSYTI